MNIASFRETGTWKEAIFNIQKNNIKIYHQEICCKDGRRMEVATSFVYAAGFWY